ncbi:hypothetical protein [Cardinium endosymbiont of Sogatella furcifera]|uniref:hypothetical protein n=1 Tax=Cardinium endosymbiont of Sogatella furcifera TaxID=650378 RepID=UPI0013B3B863|nr:hypothetical protein [Cardinium endosymbiont of Sogatella furcifera]
MLTLDLTFPSIPVNPNLFIRLLIQPIYRHLNVILFISPTKGPLDFFRNATTTPIQKAYPL